MTEYKIINTKEIYVILKTWSGGKIEIGDAYWKEEDARHDASKLISSSTNGPFISLHTITLHGSMIDVK